MKIEEARAKYGYGKPILKEELKPYAESNKENTFNQTLSNLIKFNIIERSENGIYYFPYQDEYFKDIKPSISEIVNKKYLMNYSGIRTGAFLLYKYKLTTQVSGYYEIITNNVSKNTRSKKEYDGKVVVSSSKFEINKKNIKYLEFLELLSYIKYSDYGIRKTLELLIEIFKNNQYDKEEMLRLSKHYNGYVNKGVRDRLDIIFNGALGEH